MTYPIDQPRRVCSEAERTQILDAALASRRPVSLYPGSGPRVRRSNTSAELMYDTPVTDPRVILLDLFLSVFLCGFWLPVWFYKTLRPAKIDYVTINDYGEQIWVITAINAFGELVSITHSPPVHSR